MSSYMSSPSSSKSVSDLSYCSARNTSSSVPSKSLLNEHFLNDLIWDIVQWSQTKLSLGYTALLLHDRQLHFAYFLWYEDAMGNPQVVEQHFRPENNGVLPGILSDNFYRKLTNDCFPSAANKMSVHCYELLCVHIGLVPTQHVLSHCRKLAAMLWELSDVPTAFSIL
ncbi:hypothetical protein LSH36_447g01020 [Paralvinella palmiformis]|uniref:FUZ/MON1/HPS1 third Longin domain-containing protein n=1 Tax=Paralvinella palmiformis TaxID=53620 RepID=A0AAD9JAK1_9ANNE|nr:hypothetical protein LSH36_447g01020 [Paralvinella palmiformis]